ncbi:MAG: ABC transporter substrate-binding protein [Proteobacteria bacterium]|nr:ABC transporter substrate-binding protein [Pseudomonadota bacterium]
MKRLQKSKRSFFLRWIACIFLVAFYLTGATTVFAVEWRTGEKAFEYTDKNAVYGGVYRTALNHPRSLDPHMETYANTTQVTLQTNNGLLRFNRRMDGVELDLAKSWRQIDDVTYEFKIHKGVRFHDVPPVNGRELTSADVKYSIERIAGKYGKKSNFKHSYYFDGKIASIKTPDRYTIIIKTKEPYAPFIKYVSSPWCAIVAKEVVDKHKNLKRKAIGTGPFILKKYVPGSHVELVKNPNYFKKGLPYLDGIRYTIMNKPNSILAAYLAKKFDGTGVYFFHLGTVQKKASDSIITKMEGTHMWTLRTPPWIAGKKELKPPFDKKKVRQAIAMAIDKKKLLKLAWGGFGTPQVGPVPTPVQNSLTQADAIEYNPQKAKKLLAEAGYPNGFTTELITWNLPYMTGPAQVVQAMLKEVGITVNMRFLEMAQYFNRAYRFKYDMALHVMTAGVDAEEWLVPYFGELDKSTYYKWSNREIWSMIKKQSYIMDEKKRSAYLKDIQRKVMEDSPNVFLYTQLRFGVRRPYVHYKTYMLDFQPIYGEHIWFDKH